jgi:hypothetical protein
MSARGGTATNQRKIVGGVLAIAGGAMIVVGAFLPWIKASAAFVGTISRSGMEGGDGPIFLAIGFAIAALGLWSIIGRPSAAPFLLILAGLGAGGAAFLEYSEVNQRVDSVASEFAVASVGAGIWSLFAGAAASVIAGLVLAGQMRPGAESTTPIAAAPPAGPPSALRECPHCKKAMRRDASVCPHCRQESPGWTFNEGRWWTHNDAGAWVWLDEPRGEWVNYE